MRIGFGAAFLYRLHVQKRKKRKRGAGAGRSVGGVRI